MLESCLHARRDLNCPSLPLHTRHPIPSPHTLPPSSILSDRLPAHTDISKPELKSRGIYFFDLSLLPLFFPGLPRLDSVLFGLHPRVIFLLPLCGAPRSPSLSNLLRQ